MTALRLSPSISVTLGLVSLTVLLFWILDVTMDLVPDHQRTTRLLREQASTQLALQIGVLLEHGDNAALMKTLASVQERNDDIQSIGVRRTSGEIIAQSAMHWRFWSPPPPGRSTLNHVQVPILANNEPWAYIEISFRPPEDGTSLSALVGPALTMPLSVVTGGFLLFYLYLRRVLQHLDPTQVIPARVSAALDTLTDGVMIIDPSQRVLLVNDAFRRLHPAAARVSIGVKLTSLEWLNSSFAPLGGTPPWVPVLRGELPPNPVAIDLTAEGGDTRRVMVNAAAVRDGQDKVRGCLIILRDVTELERATAHLRDAMQALQASKSQIEAQNLELQRLANHDQLTSLLNRRAFFEQGEKLVAACRSQGATLVCIMCDIDHFKSINDTHGHPVGDEAIKVVSSLLRSAVRPTDLVGRYGGEEFCVLLPGLPEDLAPKVAERIRAKIEAQADRGVRSVEGLRITSSFGLTSLKLGAESLPALIEQADEALYRSKKGGRNRVTVFAPDTNAPSPERNATTHPEVARAA